MNISERSARDKSKRISQYEYGTVTRLVNLYETFDDENMSENISTKRGSKNRSNFDRVTKDENKNDIGSNADPSVKNEPLQIKSGRSSTRRNSRSKNLRTKPEEIANFKIKSACDENKVNESSLKNTKPSLTKSNKTIKPTGGTIRTKKEDKLLESKTSEVRNNGSQENSFRRSNSTTDYDVIKNGTSKSEKNGSRVLRKTLSDSKNKMPDTSETVQTPFIKRNRKKGSLLDITFKNLFSKDRRIETQKNERTYLSAIPNGEKCDLMKQHNLVKSRIQKFEQDLDKQMITNSINQSNLPKKIKNNNNKLLSNNTTVENFEKPSDVHYVNKHFIKRDELSEAKTSIKSSIENSKYKKKTEKIKDPDQIQEFRKSLNIELDELITKFTDSNDETEEEMLRKILDGEESTTANSEETSELNFGVLNELENYEIVEAINEPGHELRLTQIAVERQEVLVNDTDSKGKFFLIKDSLDVSDVIDKQDDIDFLHEDITSRNNYVCISAIIDSKNNYSTKMDETDKFEQSNEFDKISNEQEQNIHELTTSLQLAINNEDSCQHSEGEQRSDIFKTSSSRIFINNENSSTENTHLPVYMNLEEINTIDESLNVAIKEFDSIYSEEMNLSASDKREINTINDSTTATCEESSSGTIEESEYRDSTYSEETNLSASDQEDDLVPIRRNTHRLSDSNGFRHTVLDNSGNIRIENYVQAETKEANDEIIVTTTLKNIINELQTTERSYLQGLRKIVKDYMPYLQKNCPKHVKGQDTYLFGNISIMYRRQKTFYETIKAAEEDVKAIVKAFSENDKLFKLYPQYFKTKKNAEKIIENFKEVIEKKQLELGDRLNLNSYLLTPIQRLGKYILLLKQIDKELGKTACKYKGVENTIHTLNMYMSQGNDELAIQSIKHHSYEITQFGSFLMRDEFEVTIRRKPKCLMTVFLFENLIIFTKLNPSAEEYFEFQIGIDITNLYICSDISANILRISNFHEMKKDPRNIITMETKNEALLKKWFMKLEELLWTQLRKIKKISKSFSVWSSKDTTHKEDIPIPYNGPSTLPILRTESMKTNGSLSRSTFYLS